MKEPISNLLESNKQLRDLRLRNLIQTDRYLANKVRNFMIIIRILLNLLNYFNHLRHEHRLLLSSCLPSQHAC